MSDLQAKAFAWFSTDSWQVVVRIDEAMTPDEAEAFAEHIKAEAAKARKFQQEEA